MSNDNKNAAAQDVVPAFYLGKFDAEYIEKYGGNQIQVVTYQKRPNKDAVPFYAAAPVAAAPVDGPTEVEWMMACNEIGGPDVAEEIITRAYGIAEMPRSPPAAPVEGGQITGWRNVDGMAVFTVASHSGITANQEFVRYDDHLAKLANTPAATGIDIATVEAAEDFISRHSYAWSGEGTHPNTIITGLRTMIDASHKGGSDLIAVVREMEHPAVDLLEAPAPDVIRAWSRRIKQTTSAEVGA